MEFYDIVSETCTFEPEFAERLGFSRIFTLGREILAAGSKGIGNREVPSIAFGRGEQLFKLVKQGARAVSITDSYIDRRLLVSIKENGCVLCMAMSTITASYGVERSRNIYKMSKLFKAARKLGIDVAFVSMAKDTNYMNSYIQLLELARLIGADEQYARQSISKITAAIGEGEQQ